MKRINKVNPVFIIRGGSISPLSEILHAAVRRFILLPWFFRWQRPCEGGDFQEP
jgi:hypothetical protein